MEVGAVGKGKGKGSKKGDGKKGDAKKGEPKKGEGKGGKSNNNSGAGKGKGPGTQKFVGNCNYCKKYGHMARDCRKKKAEERGSCRSVFCSIDFVNGNCLCCGFGEFNIRMFSIWQTGHGDC